jgi:alpha-L-fucosidase
MTTPAISSSPSATAQDFMAWWKEARFGIFIHWGLYSAGDYSESWSFYTGEVSYADYMAQAKQFTAASYDPDAWAALIAESGAKYAVLTAKHHDGFALWDTSLSSLNAKTASPAPRDLIGPFCEALRHRNLKVGLYFSHLDWSHPDYASIHPKRNIPESDPLHRFLSNRFGFPPPGTEDPSRWKRFLQFHNGQLKELCDRYRPDLLWFDGEWERDADQWHFDTLAGKLREWVPGVILNGRLHGQGDYRTPEQGMPTKAPDDPWEFCATMNDSWGYRKTDNNYKTSRQCIRMLAECAGMGGNLLLDIGPRADGSIPMEQQLILKETGHWLQTSAEAIYGTVTGLPSGHFYGASTLSADHTVLYLFQFDPPQDCIAVKGIRNQIRSIRCLGGKDLEYKRIGGAPWLGIPGQLWIDIPHAQTNPLATVIRIELDNPLDLFTGFKEGGGL